MNKPLITGLAISAAFVSAGAAVAGLGFNDRGPRYADVVAVAPVESMAAVGRRVCEPQRSGARRGERCRTVEEPRRVVVGYDVRYRLGREIATIRMDRRPGSRIRLENGTAQSVDTG